jgi:rod shape-determining protein MreD
MSSATGSEGQTAPIRRTSHSFRPPLPHPGRLLGRGGLALLGLALVIIVQATLVDRIRVFGVTPNLLLVTAIALSLLHTVSDGVVWAFAGGLGLDLITGAPIGTSSLAAMTACLITRLGRNRVFANNLWWPILLVALATPIYGWIVLLTEQLRGLPVEWAASTVGVIGPELLLNIAAMAVVYPVMRALTARSR